RAVLQRVLLEQRVSLLEPAAQLRVDGRREVVEVRPQVSELAPSRCTPPGRDGVEDGIEIRVEGVRVAGRNELLGARAASDEQRRRATEAGDGDQREHAPDAHWPYSRRSASESGRRAALIAAAAPATSYSMRRKVAV